MEPTSAGTVALTDFFDRYGTALTASDLPAIASCYAMPGLVVGDDATFAFSSPAAVEAAFAGAAETYREKHLIAARAELRDILWFTERLALVSVTWEYLDAQGCAVPGESFRYLMRMVDGRPMICVVIPTS
jgi:hypothetical protein